MQNFRTLWKVTEAEEREREREKMPLLVDTTFRDSERTRSDQFSMEMLSLNIINQIATSNLEPITIKIKLLTLSGLGLLVND